MIKKNCKSHLLNICLALLCINLFTITGCGNSGGAAPAATANFEGEGPVQGGIKSDEEIAALQEEEQQSS